MYLPFSLVEATRGIFVALSTRVTVAAAIAAPEGSVTVPATVPVEALCEKRAEGSKANIESKTPITTRDRLLDISSLPLGACQMAKNGSGIWKLRGTRAAEILPGKVQALYQLEIFRYLFVFNDFEGCRGNGIWIRED